MAFNEFRLGAHWTYLCHSDELDLRSFSLARLKKCAPSKGLSSIYECLSGYITRRRVSLLSIFFSSQEVLLVKILHYTLPCGLYFGLLIPPSRITFHSYACNIEYTIFPRENPETLGQVLIFTKHYILNCSLRYNESCA